MPHDPRPTEPAAPTDPKDPSAPAQPTDPTDPLNPPIPPVSSRDAPRFGSAERKSALAAAFEGQGEDYDRLRPGYPAAAIDRILALAPERPAGEIRTAVDLGAGTGKLSWALAARGLDVTAVDPSTAMLDAALAASPGSGSLRTRVGSAEQTGLPDRSADLVTAAQAWHWFDAQAASAEVMRLLRPGGELALIWNMLDVSIPWVHRLSRIMHAGDIHREDFSPEVGAGLELADRSVHSWEDPMTTFDLIDLARTRSYVITATPERRDKVLANLTWYLHEHLGHAPGSTVGVPYRTDLFLYRVSS